MVSTMYSHIPTDTVSALIREVATSVIMPAYASGQAEASTKSDGSPVTDADVRAERMLRKHLTKMSGIPVLGEEFADDEGMSTKDSIAWAKQRADSSQGFWTVDPIDGTRQFLRGKPNFAVMVSEVVLGSISRAWIYLPVQQDMYVLSQFEVSRNGVQMPFLPFRTPGKDLYGVSYVKPKHSNYVTKSGRIAVAGRGSGSVGVDYVQMLHGTINFVAHRSPKPWDHFPGTRMVQALGGTAASSGPGVYSPYSWSTSPIVTTSRYKLWKKAAQLIHGLDEAGKDSSPRNVKYIGDCWCRLSIGERSSSCSIH